VVELDDFFVVVVLVVMMAPVLVAFDMDLDRMRRDAVGDDDQAVFAVRQMLRHLEMGVMDRLAGGDAHGRVGKGTAVHRADSGPAPQAHQRIVGGHLLVVAIGAGL
jgi:hypothetical protein